MTTEAKGQCLALRERHSDLYRGLPPRMIVLMTFRIALLERAKGCVSMSSLALPDQRQ